MMGGFSRFLEEKVLDHVFGHVIYEPPKTHYIALLIQPPKDEDGGESLREASYTGYKRKSMDNNKVNWDRADDNSVTNTTLLTFERSQGGESMITHVAVCDSSVAGNVISTAKLSTAKAITQGDAPEFPPNTLTFELS